MSTHIQQQSTHNAAFLVDMPGSLPEQYAEEAEENYTAAIPSLSVGVLFISRDKSPVTDSSSLRKV